MKHTDFYQLAKEFKRKEQQELIRALEAHGGSYSWYDTVNNCIKDDHPIIPINSKNGPMDIAIRSAIVLNSRLRIYGESCEDAKEVYFEPNDVFAGYMEYIIEKIPATKDVSDVTIQL